MLFRLSRAMAMLISVIYVFLLLFGDKLRIESHQMMPSKKLYICNFHSHLIRFYDPNFCLKASINVHRKTDMCQTSVHSKRCVWNLSFSTYNLRFWFIRSQMTWIPFKYCQTMVPFKLLLTYGTITVRYNAWKTL